MRAFGSSVRKYGTVVATLFWAQSASAAKVACVGDSITFGYGLGDPSTESYPAVLAARLGAGHTVQNFGVSGATLLNNGDLPYSDQANYAASGAFDPDVVIVMLGTNDAKPQNWSREAEFSPDYGELIAHYSSLGALVYVATPPPVYGAGAFDIQPDVVANEVVPLVRTIAMDAGAPLIDVFGALSGKSELFPDTVHPNAAGAELIAETVFAALEQSGLGGMGGMGGMDGMGGMGGMGGGATAGTSGSGGNGGGAAAAGGAGGSNAGSAGTNTAGIGGTAMAGAPTAGASGAPSVGGTSSGGGAATSGAPAIGGSGGANAGSMNAAGGAPNAGSSGASNAGGNVSGGGAGGEIPGSAGDDGGCGCRAGREPGSWSSLWFALGLVFARVARSCRRRRDTVLSGH